MQRKDYLKKKKNNKSHFYQEIEKMKNHFKKY